MGPKRPFGGLLPPRSCEVRRTWSRSAHSTSLERGSFRMDLSTKFGQEFPSRDVREKRSVEIVGGKFPQRGFCTSWARIWGRILGCKLLSPEFWGRILGSTFLVLCFPIKEPPQKFTLKEFTAQNSHNWAFVGRREKTPTPKTRFSIWTLLRTAGRFTTRPFPVHFTTKMSVVRPFSVLSKDAIGP